MDQKWSEDEFKQATQDIALSDKERRILRFDMKLSVEPEYSIERNVLLRKRLRLEAWHKISKKK